MNIIETAKAPGAIGPYSQGWEAGGFIFTSGQIPVDPDSGAVPEGIAAQAEQSCKNVGAILEAAGTDLKRVVKTTCFLADRRNWSEMVTSVPRPSSLSTLTVPPIISTMLLVMVMPSPTPF